jgi:hypothetical protein
MEGHLTALASSKSKLLFETELGFLTAFFLILLAASGCSKEHAAPAPQAADIPVLVSKVTQRVMPVQLAAIGNVGGFTVSVKTQVAGELVDDAMALTSIFLPEILGKSLKYVIDKKLYPLRVDVAHAISSQTGELTLSIDELLHTQKLNQWFPLTKCIVRRMLKNEFPTEFLPYVKEDGTITP